MGKLIDGPISNAGRYCCEIERIYVHDSPFAAFLDEAVTIVNGYAFGDPLDPQTTLGPMAHMRFADTVRAHTADAVAASVSAQIDPADFPGNKDACLLPQILKDVAHDKRATRNQGFGLVIGIVLVNANDTAIAPIDDSDKGLTEPLWTRMPPGQIPLPTGTIPALNS